jgi:hypothetical protein
MTTFVVTTLLSTLFEILIREFYGDCIARHEFLSIRIQPGDFDSEEKLAAGTIRDVGTIEPRTPTFESETSGEFDGRNLVFNT